MLYNFFEVAV